MNPLRILLALMSGLFFGTAGHLAGWEWFIPPLLAGGVIVFYLATQVIE